MLVLPGVSMERFVASLTRVGFEPERIDLPELDPTNADERVCAFAILKRNAVAVLLGQQPDGTYALAFLVTRIRHAASLREIVAYNGTRRFLRFFLEDDGLLHVRTEIILLDIPDAALDQNLLLWRGAVADFLQSLARGATAQGERRIVSGL